MVYTFNNGKAEAGRSLEYKVSLQIKNFFTCIYMLMIYGNQKEPVLILNPILYTHKLYTIK